MPSGVFFIGLSAGILCTASFLPQVAKIARTKKTDDLSLVTFLMFALGVFLWFLYGIVIKDIPIIAANAVTFLLVVCILVMKVKYK